MATEKQRRWVRGGAPEKICRTCKFWDRSEVVKDTVGSRYCAMWGYVAVTAIQYCARWSALETKADDLTT